MAIPLLDYPLTSQNARVSNLAGDLHDNGLATIGYGGAGHDSYNSEVDGLIEQAYRQIFFHAMVIATSTSNHSCATATSPFAISSAACCSRIAFATITTSAAPTTEWWIRWLVAP